ncbi:hypothetical protein ACFFX0_09845 [Citricoccus parietis]|uniref:Uncharacterized protein n=1 Tax=Citricoccus parietis TaxID=592307 RepID=A0ABV5FXU4_9MICC
MPGELLGGGVDVHHDQAAVRIPHGAQTDMPDAGAEFQHRARCRLGQQLGRPRGLRLGPGPWLQHALVKRDGQAAEGQVSHDLHCAGPGAGTMT